MRLDKWFISNLDDSQRRIIQSNPDESIIVQGAAGSGKTNLALHRAAQVSGSSDSYALVVYTQALKRMISYGLETLGLDKERILYFWGLQNRGFDLIGDVYCKSRVLIRPSGKYPCIVFVDKEEKHLRFMSPTPFPPCDYKVNNGDDLCDAMYYHDFSFHYTVETVINNPLFIKMDNISVVRVSTGEHLEGSFYYMRIVNFAHLYLVQGNVVRKFDNIASSGNSIDDAINNDEFSIDFADWVPIGFYNAFGRRKSRFYEVEMDEDLNLDDPDTLLVPSGVIFKKIKEPVDYLIIDEAQDFNLCDYTNSFKSLANKSLSLFGDSSQQIYKERGTTMDEISKVLDYQKMYLKYNYRLPKSIARMAQDLVDPAPDLITNNMKDGGNSDYPRYPKPVVLRYPSEEQELDAILKRITVEDMDDVAILLPTGEEVKRVHDYLASHGVQTQAFYRTDKTVPFHTINTLDFTNVDLPCLMTFYAAKGAEFENVFIPFANELNYSSNKVTPEAFYVACTRSSNRLFISYSGNQITRFMRKVNPSTVSMG